MTAKGEEGIISGKVSGIVRGSEYLRLGAKSVSVKTEQSTGHIPECLKHCRHLKISYPKNVPKKPKNMSNFATIF